MTMNGSRHEVCTVNSSLSGQPSHVLAFLDVVFNTEVLLATLKLSVSLIDLYSKQAHIFPKITL